MRMIDKMIENLHEELDGATDYAEKFIENQARGNMSRAAKYKEMAMDELKHSNFLREMDTADVDELKKVYKLTEEEAATWEHGMKRLAERSAMVRQMLKM